MYPTTYRLALTGLGNVGSSLLSILHREKTSLHKRYGVKFLVTGVAELGGGAIDDNGLDLALLLETLRNNSPVAELANIGRPGMDGIELMAQSRPDFLLEATPVNLQHGQPGLGIAKAALEKGIHTVLANKGAVAIAYKELAAMSDLGAGWGGNFDPTFVPSTGKSPCPALRFSACVAGALPTINIGLRELAGSQITRIEAVFNGTTQYILRAMESGQSYQEALQNAQQRGIAETDPTLDVDGWDAAAKLVIVANSVLGQTTQLKDVQIQGIHSLSIKDVQMIARDGQRLVPVSLAEYVDGHYQFSVKPMALATDHPLSCLTPDEMGVVFYAGDVERLSIASSEPGPEPAAAAMLRDMLDIICHQIK